MATPLTPLDPAAAEPAGLTLQPRCPAIGAGRGGGWRGSGVNENKKCSAVASRSLGGDPRPPERGDQGTSGPRLHAWRPPRTAPLMETPPARETATSDARLYLMKDPRRARPMKDIGLARETARLHLVGSALLRRRPYT